MEIEPKTIRRAKHGKENPYFMMLRKTAQDDRLQFDERGVMAYLLSKPDDWEIVIVDLRKSGGIGRDRMKRIIDNLIECGYLAKEQMHDAETGQYQKNVYVLYEEPLTPYPYTDNRATDTTPLHNTDSTEPKNIHKDQNLEPSGSDVQSSNPGKSNATKAKRKTKPVDPWNTPEIKAAKAAARTAFAGMHKSALPGTDPGAKARVENATACFIVGQSTANIGNGAVIPITDPDEITRLFKRFEDDWHAEHPNLSLPWNTGAFPKEWNKFMVKLHQEAERQQQQHQLKPLAVNAFEAMEAR